MEDSLSITKDIGEYYIYLKDNSNLIAKGYKKSLIKKVAIETTKVFEWVIFTNEKYLQKYGQSWFKGSIQNKCYEKKVWRSKA